MEANNRGIPVWSEVELAYRFTDATFMAITGSSGKSTTTSMLGAIMQAAGKEHTVAGNIGIPLIEVVPQLSRNAFVVAELSSFQLETIDLFRPRVAAVINFMKNHLDRYDSEDAYYNAKKEIARNMTPADTLVLNARDERLMAWAHIMRDKTKVVCFGECVDWCDSYYCRDGVIWAKAGATTTAVVTVADMFLRGPHNYDNASAAAAMAAAIGVDFNAIATGVCGFKGLEHRLEYVSEVNGVRYYNDSKATTAESVLCAVTAFDRNVHLIAGGRDKGCDFSLVKEAVAKNARSVYLIGEAADRIASEWNGIAPIYRCESLAAAVDCARNNARTGDVVVLSPGCSSFDMFDNYEQRGTVFKSLVNKAAAEVA
jgi:UDP-N-acetylmuramoylalanine--D-glutamate ligase